MIDDLDIDIEYGETEIVEENIFQFELTTDTSLVYNETEKIWFLQTDEDIEGNIYILEYELEDIVYDEEVEVFGYILTIADFKFYKEIVETEKE